MRRLEHSDGTNYTMMASPKGASMHPFIKEESFITIDLTPRQTYKLGDIIVYMRGKELIAHRLIRKICTKQGFRYLTKGDNTNRADAMIPHSSVVGKVCEISYDNYHIRLSTVTQILIGKIVGMISGSSFLSSILPILRKLSGNHAAKSVYRYLIRL